MILQKYPFLFIPISHIILISNIAILAATIAHVTMRPWIFGLFIISTCAGCLISKKYRYISAIVIALLFAIQIKIKINYLDNQFQEHAELLKIPITIQAEILQKNFMFLEKDQATLLLKLKKIYINYAQVPIDTRKILLSMPAYRATKLCEGQTITIYSITLSQPDQSNSFYRYLIKESIWATAFATKERIKIFNQKSTNSFAQYFHQFRAILNKTSMQLFGPLFLGKKERSQEGLFIQHQSLYWGIAHHMARSGIHLVTIFGLFMALFHYMRIKHFYRYLLFLALGAYYLEISILSLSFLRSCCMIFIQMISKLHHYSYSSAHALQLTTLLIMLNNPYCLFFLDFQLSFGITTVIIWFFQAKWSKTIALPRRNLITS